MLKLLKFIKGHIVAAIFAPLCKLIESVAEIIVPMLVASVIDVGVANGDKAYVIKYCCIIAALAIGGFVISAIGQYLASRVAVGFGTKLRDETFTHINALDGKSSDKIGAASLITRITGDAMNCQNALNMFLRLVLRVPFALGGALVMSLITDATLSLAFLAMIIMLSMTISFVVKLAMPRVKRAQINLDEISRKSAQSLKGARVIRAFSKQNRTKAEFDVANSQTTKTNIGAAKIGALLSPLTFAVVNLAIIAVLWFGGGKLTDGALSRGELVALINYLTQAFFIIVNLGNVFSIFTRCSASAARVSQILDTPLPIDGNIAKVCPCEEVVRFSGVSFAYDGDYDVSDISFTLKKDGSLGIVGGTGSGKTTIVKLIERFYLPDCGEIYFCGNKLNDYTAAALRNAIGYVPQTPSLLSGTLELNLRMANPAATDDRLLAALDLAQAGELAAKPGLDGRIADGGKNLSGGQKQRVAIARALCRDNLLYLFDDSTSALDYRTERQFLTALRSISGAKIIVSQRISAVSDCDNIIVLDGGKIVGSGTHAELKSTCPMYAEFCASQSPETAKEAK